MPALIGSTAAWRCAVDSSSVSLDVVVRVLYSACVHYHVDEACVPLQLPPLLFFLMVYHVDVAVYVYQILQRTDVRYGVHLGATVRPV